MSCRYFCVSATRYEVMLLTATCARNVSLKTDFSDMTIAPARASSQGRVG